MKLFKSILITFFFTIFLCRIKVEGLSFGQRSRKLTNQGNVKIVNQLGNRQNGQFNAQKRKLYGGSIVGGLAGITGAALAATKSNHYIQTVQRLEGELQRQVAEIQQKEDNRDQTLSNIDSKIQTSKDNFDRYRKSVMLQVSGFQKTIQEKIKLYAMSGK